MDSSSIVLIVFVLLALYGVVIYNELVALKNRVSNAFSQIDVQLKRRYDLIPNLVNVAKEYMAHEKDTLEAVVKARNEASMVLNQLGHTIDGSGIENLVMAENSLQSALGKMNFVMEAYPDLKANENMMQLSEELTSTENKVAFARQAFNDNVMEYNIYKQSFPQILVASNFGHNEDGVLLEFEDSEEIQKAPEVKFD
jgi:LemA protein